MAKTITATYESMDQIKNAREDLIGSGIPQEKIFADEQGMQLKVMAPDTAEPEIMEILKRHRPGSTSVH
jgi:hypothetical protein